MAVIPVCVDELVPHACDYNIVSDKALYGMSDLSGTFNY